MRNPCPKTSPAMFLMILGIWFCISDLASALDDEGLALLAFRQQITNDPLHIFDSWNSQDATPCAWTGIVCDQNNNVSKILLQNSQLSGTISGQLSRLHHLRVLGLSKNFFTGSIPSQIEDIHSLWKLNVSQNALSGQIPPELGNLGSLRMLDLSTNLFYGAIPEQLFVACGRLRYISLSGNNLSSTIPLSLGSCPRLVGIDFANNFLQGSIPSQLGALSALQYLSLTGNALAGFLPQALMNCTALSYLDVSRNQLYGQIPLAFVDLTSLASLIAAENLFTGNLPSGILYQPSLQFLNLSFNGLSGQISPLPTGGSCSSLQVLDLAVNNFSGSIPETFGSCSRLSVLNVSGNYLSGSIPTQLGNLSLARSIDLSDNNLSGVIPPEIGNLINLSVLRLGMNPVQGSIPPDIGKIGDLIILDLQRMDLQGNIPLALADCRFLLELDLSHNNLSGTIPGSLSNITYLKLLDLENNNLSGSIPMELGNLSNLEHLDLSVNQLTGSIPASLGNIVSLSFLNLSYNRLSGPIPRVGSLQRFNMSSFLGNTGLCGSPLSNSCSALSSTGARTKSHVLRPSAIAAIAAAAVIAFGVVIITVMNVRALRKGREALVYESTPPPPDSSPILGKLVLFSKTLPSKYEDWEAGTKALLDNECIIGNGALGTVYKATFDAGISMAVKKLETLGRIKNAQDFEEEIGRLANVRHRNLVVMQGFFWSSTMQLLLSDFIPNGNLFSHLHQRRAGQPPLNWQIRFRIATGTARGLAYLHHDFRPPILHYDLKSSNILLDNYFEPHISDYGISKLLPMLDTYVSSRKFHSALGYIAPELACQSIRLTEKCDVYSFGIILLELATGRQPVENAEPDVVVLCEHVRSALEQGRGASCIDRDLRSASENEIMQVLKLGLVCTSQTPSKRPSMAEVVQVLESIKPGNDL